MPKANLDVASGGRVNRPWLERWPFSFCLVSVVVIGCTDSGGSNATTKTEDAPFTHDEVCILLTALQEYGPEEQGFAVVESETLDPTWMREDVMESLTGHGLGEDSPLHSSSGAAAMLAANRVRCVLPKEIEDNPSFRLAARDDLEKMFRHCFHEYRRFYARFPGATCLLSVSRPGISPSGTNAAVYVTWQAESLVGEGTIFFLEKVDGEWKIIDSICVYVS